MLKILTTSQEREAELGPETLDALALRGAQSMVHQAWISRLSSPSIGWLFSSRCTKRGG